MSFAFGPKCERPHTRPLRSLLFIPGSDEKRVPDAAALGADAVVLDLEEPETPMSEAVRERAQQVAGGFLRGQAAANTTRPDSAGAAPLWFVRTRAPATGYMWRDLQAVVCPALTGILLPKIEGPEDVVAADALLLAAEAEAGLAPDSLQIYPILETAQALRLAYEIAMASPRIAYMGGAVSRFGDIHRAVGYTWTAGGRETHFLRSKVLVDARAAGIRYPISGMWGGDTHDLEGLRRWALELREQGYYGMMLGAPQHLPLVHEVFTPHADEIAYWRDLVRLAAEAEARGTGPILYGDPSQGEGHEVHIAHVESARRNLEWAEALGVA
jgi:citrate lyase subunit beta/citryl-CoA lyase